MTRREAAIITAYTGIVIGEFCYFHEYAEEIMGRPVFTHEFANEKTAAEIKAKSYNHFISIKVED